MRACAITTIDNPHDPFEDFKKWLDFDVDHNYHTCERLARLAKTSDSLPDKENFLEIENAIDRMIEIDCTKLYKKLVYDIKEPSFAPMTPEFAKAFPEQSTDLQIAT